MSVTIQGACTHCQRTIAVPANVAPGKNVRCPHCQQTFSWSSGESALSSSVQSPPATQASPPASSAGKNETVPPTANVNQVTWTYAPHDATAATGPAPRKLGRFEIRRALGEGSFGVVYEAYDPQLDRAIALKVAKFGRDNEQRVKRFQREARSAANLRHPHIVPLHEYGQEGEQFYLALAYIPGRTLGHAISELNAKKEKMDCRRAATLVRQLAEALAYAHGLGIVHRDIKPHNVMLDERGDALLMDFGLAAREEDEKLTREGTIMGTAAYLAPEQYRGEPTAASDQYSLGVSMYELLTGETPFSGASDVQIHHHLNVEPPSPRKRNPAVTRDLETICLKCLEKDAAKRYVDCLALAEDLRRWLDGEPVTARRPGPVERLTKWARRSPAVAGLSLATALVLVTGTTVATFFGLQARENERIAIEKAKEAADNEKMERLAKEQVKAEKANVEVEKANVLAQHKETEKALKKSQFEEAKAKFVHYAYLMREAQAKIAAGQGNDAKQVLAKCDPINRSWEHLHLLRRIDRQRLRIDAERNKMITNAVFTPDGKSIAGTVSSGFESTVMFWDAQTGREQHSFLVDAREIAFDPAGSRILTFTSRGMLKVLNARTGAELLTIPSGIAQISCAQFSGNGERIVACGGEPSRPSQIKIWSAKTAEQIFSLDGHSDRVRSVCFSADGTRIISGSSDKTVRIWDANTGKAISVLKGHTGDVSCVDISRNGQRIASVSAGADPMNNPNGEVKLWDAVSGTPILSIPIERENASCVCFSPDGTRLATNGMALARIWNASTGRLLVSLSGHQASAIYGVRFSPDGNRLVSVGIDRTARVWNAQPGEEELCFPTEIVSAVSVSSDNECIAAGGQDNSIRVWNMNTGASVLALKGHTQPVGSVCFSIDGSHLASGSQDCTIRVWNSQTGSEEYRLEGHTGPVASLDFSPDGRQLASACAWEKTVRIWDTRSKRVSLTLQGHMDNVSSVKFSSDGKRIVTGSVDQTVRIWDARSGGELAVFKGHAKPVLSASFDRDGVRVVSASQDSTIKIWDVKGEKETVTLLGHTDTVNDVKFSPDGKRLVSGSHDNSVRIWDSYTGQEALALGGNTKWVLSVAFSPNGTRIVAGGVDRTVRIWDATPISPIKPTSLRRAAVGFGLEHHASAHQPPHPWSQLRLAPDLAIGIALASFAN